MKYGQAILEQTIYIQRESDRLLGRDRMDYQQFCEAIDEMVPSGSTTINKDGILSDVRQEHKAFGGLIQVESGKSYYEIYLSIKYKTDL